VNNESKKMEWLVITGIKWAIIHMITKGQREFGSWNYIQ